eukprot:jgi/Chlat1/4557/Chrsp29S04462
MVGLKIVDKLEELLPKIIEERAAATRREDDLETACRLADQLREELQQHKTEMTAAHKECTQLKRDLHDATKAKERAEVAERAAAKQMKFLQEQLQKLQVVPDTPKEEPHAVNHKAHSPLRTRYQQAMTCKYLVTYILRVLQPWHS